MKNKNKKIRWGFKMNELAHKTRMIVVMSVFLAATMFANFASASVNTPTTINYQGRLLDSANHALTGTYDFRFSFWSDADVDSGDFNPADNSINTSATGYADWQEEQTATTDAFGLFNIEVGALNAISNANYAQYKYMQVEVKANGAPASDYEVLDPDGVDNADDRKALQNQMFASTADTLDYVIDADQTGDVINLRFGELLLNAALSYDPNGIAVGDGWFEFSDDVNIQGDLTVTGTINGGALGAINRQEIFEPEYQNSVVTTVSGSNGTLELDYEDPDGVGDDEAFNYYKWTTQQGGPQSLDVVVRFKVPEGFSSWQAVPVTLDYRTGNGDVGVNDIDLEIEDTADTEVSLNNAVDLANTAWTTADITFNGSPVWTAGEEGTIKIRLTTNNSGAIYLGKLILNYIGT